MSDVKLKPCPFCGGEAIRNDENTVQCGNVECFQPAVLSIDQSAAIFWNTRSHDARLIEALERAEYICTCVEAHAEKFPAPDHMRAHVATVREALTQVREGGE